MFRVRRSGVCVAVAVVLCVAASAVFAADLMDTAMKQRDLSMFVKAVHAAGLAGDLKGTGPFTVFAPSDAAFNRLPKATLRALMEPKNKKKLAAILKYHLINGSAMADKIKKMRGGSMIVTIEGRRITITHGPSGVFVNGVKVTMTDIKASNGVIHVIDGVLMPPKK